MVTGFVFLFARVFDSHPNRIQTSSQKEQNFTLSTNSSTDQFIVNFLLDLISYLNGRTDCVLLSSVILVRCFLAVRKWIKNEIQYSRQTPSLSLIFIFHISRISITFLTGSRSSLLQWFLEKDGKKKEGRKEGCEADQVRGSENI